MGLATRRDPDCDAAQIIYRNAYLGRRLCVRKVTRVRAGAARLKRQDGTQYEVCSRPPFSHVTNTPCWHAQLALLGLVRDAGTARVA